MQYDAIRPVHTFFLGNLSVPNGSFPQVYRLIEAADPRLQDFLAEHGSVGHFIYSYYPRAYTNVAALYSVYIHFESATVAAAFRLVWDGEPPLQNY